MSHGEKAKQGTGDSNPGKKPAAEGGQPSPEHLTDDQLEKVSGGTGTVGRRHDGHDEVEQIP